MARFGRVVTAMVTPFHKDGSLNLDGARRLAKWLQENGNDGLVVAGTTGESPVLTDVECLSLFEVVIGAVTIPVIAGTGTNDTATHLEQVLHNVDVALLHGSHEHGLVVVCVRIENGLSRPLRNAHERLHHCNEEGGMAQATS